MEEHNSIMVIIARMENKVSKKRARKPIADNLNYLLEVHFIIFVLINTI